MPSTNFSIVSKVVLTAIALNLTTIGAPLQAFAQTEKILHKFNSTGAGTDGYTPVVGLVFDTAGNLYGTTQGGGKYGGGIAFELMPSIDGTWSEKILHDFGSTKDGTSPSSGLIFDSAGNLYGTTLWGGTNGTYGGTVFELSPQAGGRWSEKILHNFGSGKDGWDSEGKLAIDAVGNLYGTAAGGGAYGGGIAYELMPTTGPWDYKILHNFGNGNDGASPTGGLVLDSMGNLYGTTVAGGEVNQCTDYWDGCGTVFELSPQVGAGWKESILHAFNYLAVSGEGVFPYGTVALDASGNVYGMTYGGGGSTTCVSSSEIGCGNVFELRQISPGHWKETILYNFNGGTLDGANPYDNLTFDASGNLYGTTEFGGTYGVGVNGLGTIVELSPVAGGGWTEKVMYSLGNDNGGELPYSPVIFDAAGNLYGTTSSGGNGFPEGGTVFEITP